MILVDSGNFLSDDQTAHGILRADAAAKNEWVLKAYDQFRVDALNLSAHDLFFLAPLMQKKLYAERVRIQPVFHRMISANVRMSSPGLVNPEPFIVQEVVERGSSRKIRVGITGALSPVEAGGATVPSLRVTDPVAALSPAVSELRRKTDVVIALVHMKTDEAIRVAREVKGLDVMIAGNGELFTPPIRIGQTLVVFAPSEARMLGEIRFQRNAEGTLQAKERFVSIDDQIPDDSEALVTIDRWRADSQKAMTQYKRLILSSNAPTAAANSAGYRAAQACSTCHLAQYVQWANTRHARASDTLSVKPTEFDASCLHCHGSGFTESQSAETELRYLMNVQCEHCHGPGAEHIAKPAKGYGRVSDAQVLCLSCHTTTTSPSFDFKTAWSKIKH
ncbi:MAG TPA: multiheme c-type cytochrome [Blastocatellia bacterium]|nr:multiheme c-type cytochrome [Blastocatellia bacterium]